MKTLRLAPLFGALLLLVGCRGTDQMATEGPGPMSTAIALDLAGTSPNNTVLENAMAVPELSMLVNAIQRAGLTDDLSGDGPYTVFAPINPAFARAEADMDDPAELRNALLYHVAEGDVMAGGMVDGMTLVMLDGNEASIGIDAGEPSPNIDGADVLYSDIESSNGVIHVINLVLNPTLGGHIDTN